MQVLSHLSLSNKTLKLYKVCHFGLKVTVKHIVDTPDQEAVQLFSNRCETGLNSTTIACLFKIPTQIKVRSESYNQELRH